MNIYIFLPTYGANQYEINNTKTVRFYTAIAPYGEELSARQYITVVRNGNHYEPAMTNAAGRVWQISNDMKQIARIKFNSSEDDSIIFCTIE